MRRHGTAVHLGAAALSGLIVLSACTAGPSSRPEIVVNDGPGDQSPPTSASIPVPVPPLEEPQSPRVTWGPCAEEVTTLLAEPPLPESVPVECARVISVLDSPYAPGMGQIRLQVLRAGTGSIPLVVVNDVNGLPGTVYAARLAATLPPEFLSTFSLIGLDRRGTGNSAEISCVPPEVRAAIATADPAQQDVDGWIESAQTAGQRCSIALESRLPAMDTWRTAADLTAVRDALGVPKLHAIGHGEGSRVLTVFADRYPDQVGRMVLDGVPDPTQDAVIALEGVAIGAQATFTEFAADCARRSCELGADAETVLTDLLAGLRTGSTPSLSSDSLPMTAGMVLRAVLTGLADRAAWPELSRAIDDARNGDGNGLAAFLEPVLLDIDPHLARFDASLVIGCNDTKTRLTPQQLTSTTREWHEKYPLFGALVAQRLALCSPWTVPGQPLPTPIAEGSPPIVVLGAASDPVTPHRGTHRAVQQLGSAVMVTWQGAGHGALGNSECATEAALAFLTDATVPHDGTACPP